MIGKVRLYSGGAAVCLAGAVLVTSLGCQQANHPPSSSPGKNKPAEQKPDNKPSGTPKPDVG
ncbi:MAG: hypothetical protein ACYC3I_07610 [Gemmataceae bacterium]